MGFVRTIVRRQVASYIDEIVHNRREELDIEVGARIPDRPSNPEQRVAFRQKVQFMKNILPQLSKKVARY